MTIFRDVEDLKKTIIDLQNNQKIFSSVQGGLYQRKDKDRNISFRMKDRTLRSFIGANIDFDYMKFNTNIDENNLDINVIIRDDSLLIALKNSNLKVVTGTQMRRVGVSLNPAQIGEIHIHTFNDLMTMFQTFESNIKGRKF